MHSKNKAGDGRFLNFVIVKISKDKNIDVSAMFVPIEGSFTLSRSHESAYQPQAPISC